MRVVTDAGASIELGTTETGPTIGITDYSRRVTDDYGVTTVVERGFARTMSVRFALPIDAVDDVQRRLAALRATPARWIADERFASLGFRGFYKDFSLDVAVAPLGYCTLTVEGLASTDAGADPGGDPAVPGTASTLRLLQPVVVTDAMLVASSVPETDAAEWSSSATYPLGARVIRGLAHRIYESAADGNASNDPAGASGKWLDVGATNRWAMFDQALGSATTAADQVTVTLRAGAIGAVALLDVIGATVRVQAAGYDRAQPVGTGAVTFRDLPGNGGDVTVTVTGQQVAIGTLLVGTLVALGCTETSPTAAITDYSRKDVDDFGEVTVVQRAWAKRMTAKALIRTDAVDLVTNRIAAVRARPSLWIGGDGVDCLTIYGFFKDFSVEVGETTSMLALSIEGLSTAARIEPLKASVDWPDVGDPDGTKPTDNADVTADVFAGLSGGRTPQQVIDDLDLGQLNILAQATEMAQFKVAVDQLIYDQAGNPIGVLIAGIQAQVGGQQATYAQLVRTDDGVFRAVTTINQDGVITGTENLVSGGKGEYWILADVFGVIQRDGSGLIKPFVIENGIAYFDHVKVRQLDADVVNTANIKAGQVTGLMTASFPDVQVTATETTIAEWSNLKVGDGKDGRALVLVSFSQDGTGVEDTGMQIRAYVDVGSGYVKVRDKPSGIRVSGGDARWILPVAFPVSILASGLARVKITGQATQIGGGGGGNSYARDIELDVFQGSR